MNEKQKHLPFKTYPKEFRRHIIDTIFISNFEQKVNQMWLVKTRNLNI